MSETMNHQFDAESQVAINTAVQEVRNILAETPVAPIDIAIAGARVYLTVAEHLGGHPLDVRFVHDNKIVSMGMRVTTVPSDQEFEANGINIEHQKMLAMAIMDGFDKAVELEVISDYEQGAMFVAALRVLYMGLIEDPSVKELRFRHSQKNNVINILNPARGNSENENG